MNSLNKKSIKFYTTDEIYKIVIDNRIKEIPLKRLGIEATHKIMVSNILYKNYNIKIRPYRLYVEEKSYDKCRLPVIKYIIEEIARRKQINNSDSTIKGFIRNSTHFFKWINENNIEFPKNVHEAQLIFQKYVFTLKNYIKSERYVQSECHTYFMLTAKLLKTIFNDKNSIITSGITPITNRKKSTTQKPTNEDITYAFNFYYQLFNQISDFLIEEKQYPFKLKLPNQELWVIPSRYWYKREETILYLKSYDYNTGQILSVKEIQKAYNFKEEKTAYDYRNNFMYKLHDNNINIKSKQRKLIGRLALRAYFMHFLAITGMNDSTAATLTWNNDYKIESEQYSFKNIKYRAHNKVVDFKIQKEFVNGFKKFLQLRDYLLNGHNFEYLFFSFDGKEASLSSKQKSGTFSSYINKDIKNTIDPNLPIITSKQYRVHKVYQVIKKDGVFAAATLAQNLTSTIVSNYITESESSTMEQFTSYFNKLNENIILKKDIGTSTAIGQCKEINKPKTKFENKNFLSNCSNQEGCLFCDKYGVHADETDIRKLYSLKYIINECKYIASKDELFNKVYSPIINRIDNILNEMKKQDKKNQILLNKIKYDVFENESLTPYFEHKLKTLLKLGVLK